MRHIKFRQAKFKDGAFIGFHYWGFINGAFIGADTGRYNPNSAVNNSKQYTGRNIATGAELYDGDIIQFKFRTKTAVFEYTGKIYFDEYMWLVETEGGEIFSLNRIHGIQLLGNIRIN